MIVVKVGPKKEPLRALKTTVKARFSGTVLCYILTLEKNDAVKVVEDFEDLAKQLRELDIELLDKDEFRISSISIKSDDLVTLVGQEGRPEGQQANASTFCNKTEYAGRTPDCWLEVTLANAIRAGEGDHPEP